MTQPADAANPVDAFLPPAEASPQGEPMNDGQALISRLQAKTKFDPNATAASRPGWDITLKADLLPASSWSAEQRKRGVKVEFVTLTMKEHRRAEGRMARRFREYGGDAATLPHVAIEERCILALTTVDGRPVGDDDESKDAAWERFGPPTQAYLFRKYIEAVGADPESIEKSKSAQESADATFRVRGLRPRLDAACLEARHAHVRREGSRRLRHDHDPSA